MNTEPVNSVTAPGPPPSPRRRSHDLSVARHSSLPRQGELRAREVAAGQVVSTADGCVGAPAGRLEPFDGRLWLQKRLSPGGAALFPGPHPRAGPRSLEGGRSLLRLPGGGFYRRRDPHRYTHTHTLTDTHKLIHSLVHTLTNHQHSLSTLDISVSSEHAQSKLWGGVMYPHSEFRQGKPGVDVVVESCDLQRVQGVIPLE